MRYLLWITLRVPSKNLKTFSLTERQILQIIDFINPPGEVRLLTVQMTMTQNLIQSTLLTNIDPIEITKASIYQAPLDTVINIADRRN
jgi:hypothetical protein